MELSDSVRAQKQLMCSLLLLFTAICASDAKGPEIVVGRLPCDLIFLLLTIVSRRPSFCPLRMVGVTNRLISNSSTKLTGQRRLCLIDKSDQWLEAYPHPPIMPFEGSSQPPCRDDAETHRCMDEIFRDRSVPTEVCPVNAVTSSPHNGRIVLEENRKLRAFLSHYYGHRFTEEG